MKTLNILVIISLASVLTLGCINQTATPTPLPAPTVTPTPTPTITPTPLPTYLPVSYISNVQQTTNGRNYTAPSITAIPNASKGGLMTGELGRQ